MKKVNSLSRILLTLSITAFFMTISLHAFAANPRDVVKFNGTYTEINNDSKACIASLTFSGDNVFIGNCGLYDLDFGYGGPISNVSATDNELSFDCILDPVRGMEGTNNLPAQIRLTHQTSGEYLFEASFGDLSDERLYQLTVPTPMYRGDVNEIKEKVPVKLPARTTIKSIISALAPYIFKQEFETTEAYLAGKYKPCKTEMIRWDETNRFVDYSWGSENLCMECKYWPTNDGNILFIVNFHDATYQYPQTLRFFLINKREGSMRELHSALADNWPVGEAANEQGIVYQLRPESNGVVALVPEKYGDSFDVVTLKFDGQTFN